MQDQFLIILLVEIHVLIYLESMLNEDLIGFKLDGLSLHNLLFDRPFGYQTINIHIFALAYSVGSIHGLQVDLWVKVWIE